jgi:hypothetical protein
MAIFDRNNRRLAQDMACGRPIHYRGGMKGWFGRKRFGIGVGPASWQGWLATAILILALIGDRAVPYARWGWPGWAHQSGSVAALVLFLVVVWLTYSSDVESDV